MYVLMFLRECIVKSGINGKKIHVLYLFYYKNLHGARYTLKILTH